MISRLSPALTCRWSWAGSGKSMVRFTHVNDHRQGRACGHPAEVRKRLGLAAGTELEMVIEGFAIRLVRAVAGPQLVRRGERLIARPRVAEGERAEVDVPRLIEEERHSAPTRT